MRIESFEHGCRVKGYDPTAILPDVSMLPEELQKPTIAAIKLFVICQASRSKDPDWNDRSERKWYPWFDMEKSKNNPTGFRFLVSDYGISRADTCGGSRLCYESEKDSNYHGKQHIGLYKDLMVIE